MATSEFVVEVRDDRDFETAVLVNSRRVPVLVDFWAAWCAPCKMLMPVLEQLARNYGGRFLLVKVNSDEHPELSTRYGVRSLPTVKLFKGGAPADEFVGALPESQIRAFLDRHIERESDQLAEQAVVLFHAGQPDAAVALAAQAHASDPDNARVTTRYLELLLDTQRADAAEQILNTLPATLRAQPSIAALEARMTFLHAAREAVDVARLQQTLAKHPDDLAARVQLAARLAAQTDYEAALRELLDVLRRNRGWDNGIAHKLVLKIFEVLGGQGPLVSRYRGELARLLH